MPLAPKQHALQFCITPCRPAGCVEGFFAPTAPATTFTRTASGPTRAQPGSATTVSLTLADTALLRPATSVHHKPCDLDSHEHSLHATHSWPATCLCAPAGYRIHRQQQQGATASCSPTPATREGRERLASPMARPKSAVAPAEPSAAVKILMSRAASQQQLAKASLTIAEG